MTQATPLKHTNRLAHETSPYLLQQRSQPGRLVSLGRGGPRKSPPREQADLPPWHYGIRLRRGSGVPECAGR